MSDGRLCLCSKITCLLQMIIPSRAKVAFRGRLWVNQHKEGRAQVMESYPSCVPHYQVNKSSSQRLSYLFCVNVCLC